VIFFDDNFDLLTFSSSVAGGSDTPAQPLYTVLAEKKVERIGTQLLAPSHVYDIAAVGSWFTRQN
jgi:hypothetical protein